MPKTIVAKDKFAEKNVRFPKIFAQRFFLSKELLRWKYKLHITLEAEIWHFGSTHKKKDKLGVEMDEIEKKRKKRKTKKSSYYQK